MMSTPIPNPDLHSRLRSRDGGGAQAEPQNGSVRGAPVQQRNPRTGDGFDRLTAPAPEHQAVRTEKSRPNDPEAEDTPRRGRGSAGRIESLDGEMDFEDFLEEIDFEDQDEIESILYAPSDDEEHERTQMNRPTSSKASHTKKMEQGPKPGKKIGCLNMRGAHMTTRGAKHTDKFPLIIKWMRNEKISILSLVDMHWDKEMEDLQKQKHQSLRILCSHGTTRRGGVAFIIDEKAEVPKQVDFTTIQAGRSAAVKIQYEGQSLEVATIYVPPNNKREKIETLKLVRHYLEREGTTDKTILTGDFNLVESEIDRSPQHPDDWEIVFELLKLKAATNLVDGWRKANGDDLKFTWKGRVNDDYSYARIDRIYVPDDLLQFTNEWAITPMEESISDHAAVTVKILETDPPFIGRGEWRLNLKLLDHPHFQIKAGSLIEKMKNEMSAYESNLRKTRGDQTRIKKLRKRTNPQSIWTEYKEGIKRSAKEAQEIRRKTILKQRRELEKEKKRTERELGRNPTAERSTEIRTKMAKIDMALSDLITENRKKAEASVAARWFREDERGSKLWYSQNKERPKRHILNSLMDTDGSETRNTEQMMRIAKTHHENLQARPDMTPEREAAILEVLQNVDDKLNDEQRATLSEEIPYGEILKTIRNTPCGKSPGCDGIPHEFWKQELDWHKRDEKQGKSRANIVHLMKKIFDDIDSFGPIDSNFASARMSLLYKKKDRRRIENYRPITLLNTDYKIYTTILTERLKDAASMIIHPDQAGFMPKRSIYDQTKLTELMIKLCENQKRNGAIVALDQEKAYDRIDHAYLWKIMRKYGLPEKFISRVRNLYEQAQTAILLNGCTTDAFWIQRGVRQGDPLSCLLYNIAIEPLFEIIRRSELDGIAIHRNIENALVSAYADDTECFLSETDNYETLENCIKLFCNASTAKFNNEKTEIIPVGDPEYREEVIRTRIVCGKHMSPDIHIAKEGEAIRILGAWQGNGADATAKWNEILEKQLQIMKRWANSYPTLPARVRVAKALVVSRALYLMTVNGIPKNHLDQMEKNIRNFIWLGKKGSVSWERAIQHKDDGGLGAPSIKILYEATKVMWIKRWLTPDENRPKWAWAANAILESCAQNSPRVDENAMTEWVEQLWRVKLRSTLMPPSLEKMLRAAQKYNVKISVLRAPRTLKLAMPAFFHPAPIVFKSNNSKSAKCLRTNHKISSMRELEEFSQGGGERAVDECLRTTAKCRRYARKMIANISELWNPAIQTPAPNHLYHTPARLAKYETADIRATPIAFNPDPNGSTCLLENVRVFGARPSYKNRDPDPEDSTPKHPTRTRVVNPRGTPKSEHKIEIYTDGSADRNGFDNGDAGIGIWHTEGSMRNYALRLGGNGLSNQRAELAAITLALQTNYNDDLLIYSDSLTSLQAICKHLLKWEDLAWHKIKNADLLMEILALLRTRPGTCEFKWVKAHAANAGNNQADLQADEGRLSDDYFALPNTTPQNTRELHDGAKLSSLRMKDVYSMLLHTVTKSKSDIKHPELLEDSQDMILTQTGLKPTKDAIIKGIWKVGVPGRLRDHLWNMTLGRIKIGGYWRHIPNYEERTLCTFCIRNGERHTEENEQHLWLGCQYNGQNEAWETAKCLWAKASKHIWPHISLGILRGVGALTLTDNQGQPTKDFSSERIRILVAMTTWAIWKVRNKHAILLQPVTPSEASNLLIELLKENLTKSWNALKFEPDKAKTRKERRLRKIWADGKLVHLETGKNPIFDF